MIRDFPPADLKSDFFSGSYVTAHQDTKSLNGHQKPKKSGGKHGQIIVRTQRSQLAHAAPRFLKLLPLIRYEPSHLRRVCIDLF